MTLSQMLLYRLKNHALSTQRNDGFLLTTEEMSRGILLTKCPTCQDTTRHQTVSPEGKPFLPNANSIARGFYMHCFYRKCLECGTVHSF